MSLIAAYSAHKLDELALFALYLRMFIDTP
jgi:hypothetical protein